MARAADAAADLALLREAGERAGAIALGYFGRKPQVWYKGGTSPVSEADVATDDFLRRTLLSARPDYGWLSEETVDAPARLDARRTFVVDPIDGTRAFIEGQSRWCVSLAVVEKGRPLAGVLVCPVREEVFWASAGEGAWLDGNRLGVREAPARPVIAGPKPMIAELDADLRETAVIHPYVPSLAYRLAMVAAGRIDASFVKQNAHDWDIAAADLILTEAGGLLLEASGSRPSLAGPQPRRGALVAGSGALLDRMAATLSAKFR